MTLYDASANEHPSQLEQFRSYLRMLAQAQLDTHLQGKIDASDIVQMTLFEAYQGQLNFRGKSPEERAGWLRRILARNLADEIRKFRRQKRDLGLEQSMQAAVNESALRLEGWLAAGDSLPDQRAERNEQLLQLAAALEALPEEQRQAVVLHHLQGQSAAEIAAQLGRTEVAVAGLLRRGIKKLRELLQEKEGD